MEAPIDWDSFVLDAGPRLYDYFCASFSRDLASELVQETLFRLVKKYRSGGFDVHQGSLRMLAFGIAHNVRLENYRENARKANLEFYRKIESAEPAQSSEMKVLSYQENERVSAAIQRLPEEQRSVILLLINEELSLSEIAAILEQPLNTIKSHVFRAKALLRELLSEETLWTKETKR